MTDPRDPAGEGPGPDPAEPFLRRWSRRKEQSRAGGSVPEGPEGEPAEAGRELPTEPLEDPGPEPTDADMPPLEKLDGGSDLSAFFGAGVSEELRRQALRRVFHSPEFNRRDGLEVYDEDYRSFQGLGEVITQHMRQRLEREAERLARWEEGEAPASAGESGEAPGPEPEDPPPGPDSDPDSAPSA
ncbi:MAG: DUF3306 domain-containing protein [Gemmatimonadetes bacterium]|nr:DUF3306 domain-containing protein [Gemmatimonadota bacterium]NIU36437.1 DUF3306 domain-containing protein [Gemmatimonadota bacterium]NIV62184.1 DUF3306 domain-containing protein [Gemmatimonadota bacterium]NIV83349.1 DUF3306 domain-containing protein [Gemmatimonadota bacterium]NIW64906.1 DUF3306 domain-containing protein [Gemmatimonadota bacterium]